MSGTWVLVLALAGTSIALRIIAPLVIGERDLPPWLRETLLDAGPTLLAAMVVVLLRPGDAVPLATTLTASAGVAAGVLLLALRRSILTAMLAAAAVCAALRLLS